MKDESKNRRMRFATLGLLISFSFGLVGGCAKPKELSSAKPKPPVSVVVGTPVVMPIVEWDEFVGRLAPLDAVQVRSRVSGFLATTHFEEGQMVRAGDLIAVIDQRPFLAEVARNQATLAAAEALLVQANASVAQSEAEKERAEIRRNLTKKLLDRNEILRKENATALQDYEVSVAEYEQAEADILVSKSKVESAKSSIVAAQAAVGVAQAGLDLAKLNLQYTEIRAPINGRISSRLVTEGNLVSGGTNDSTLLTTIVSQNPIHCYFDADEQTFLKYGELERSGKQPSNREVRNPVFLALANEKVGYPHQGHLDFLENRMDEQTGTIRCRAILPNEKMELTPGLFARVRLPGSPRYEAVLIPDKAIGTDQAEKFVMTVDDGNKIVRKLVTLGPMSHGLRIIRSGLQGNERIILSGLQRAQPGAEATVKPETVVAQAEQLPDEYEPVPEEKWLTPKRTAAGNVLIPVGSTSAPTPAPTVPTPTVRSQP